MMKRWMSMLLCTCLLLALLPMSVMAEDENTNAITVKEETAEVLLDTQIQFGLQADHITGHIGYAKIIDYYLFSNYPMDNVTMASADPSIADVVKNDRGAWELHSKQLGTTTITATTTSGMTDTCAVTVKEIETLELDVPKTVTVHPADSIQFYFTPDENAQYTFFSEDGEGYLVAMDTSVLLYEKGVGTFEMSAGKTVSVHLQHNDYEGIGEHTFTIYAKKSVPVEEIKVEREVYAGCPGNILLVRFYEYPVWHQVERYKLSSSNPSVASVPETSSVSYFGSLPEGLLTMHAPGTATITITSANGITETCLVKVLEPESILLGEEKEITTYCYEERQFSFTPETSGEYIFYVPHDEIEYDQNGRIINTVSYCHMRIYDNGTEVGEFVRAPYHVGKKYYMEAGKTYILSAMQQGEDNNIPSTHTVRIQKLENSQQVYFDKDKIEVERERGSFELYLRSSECGFFPDDVIWTSSNPNAVYVEGNSGTGYWEPRGTGMSIITATLSNGVSASCQITVLERYEEIKVGEERTVTLTSGSSEWYTFAPETSGYYVFHCANNALSLSFGNVDDSDMEYVFNDSTSGYMCYMQAGRAYDLTVYFKDPLDSEAIITDTVYLDAYSAPKGVFIDSVSLEHCWPNDQIWIQVSCEEGFISSKDQATWTSSNTDVIKFKMSDSIESGVFTAIAPGNATISVTYNGTLLTHQSTVNAPGVYTVIEGADTVVPEGGNQSLTVQADGHIYLFREIKVDGNKVTGENYTVTPGSTIIELHADYLATLAPGKHTLDICFKDGNATTSFTIGVPAPEVKFVGASLSLKGDIGLNYYAEVSQKLLADTGAYMKFTGSGAARYLAMADGILDESDGSYRYSVALNAKNMGDNVTAQVYNATGAVGEGSTLSIKYYADYVINNSEKEVFVNLMKAMLNYGAAAQVEFGYDTENLVNADMTEADRTLPETLDVAKYAHTWSGEEEGIEVTNASLLLQSETKIRIYFKLAEGKTLEDFTFTIDGVEVTPVQSGDEYYIEKTNVAAKDLDTMYTFCLGNRQLTYCGLSYVNQVLGYSSDADLLNLVKALYVYNQAANAYFAA